MQFRHTDVHVAFQDAYQLKQKDLLNFIHENPKFDELIGCDVYGIALAYIQNLELQNKQLLLKIKFFETIDKFMKQK